MVVYISLISSTLMTFPPEGYSLKWYLEIVNQSRFIKAFFVSVQVAVIAMIISLALGLLSGIAITRFNFKGKGLLLNLFLTPLVVPSIISGIALYVFLFNMGQIMKFNLVPSFWSLVIAHVIITIPWTVRLILAGLQGMDKSIEEAAVDLGASTFQVYKDIILPSIKPSIVAASIFAFIVSFNNLEISLMLVSPGQTTLPIEMLNYVVWKLDPLIAAISVVQLALIAVMTLIVNRFVGLSKVL